MQHASPTMADLVDGERLLLLQLPIGVQGLLLQEETHTTGAVQEVCVRPEHLHDAACMTLCACAGKRRRWSASFMVLG